VATGVTDALEALEHTTVDAVLTDQALIGAKGTELARHVRARWPAVKIIVVTGFDDDAELTAAIAAGELDLVIPKPWTPTALRARVMALVRPTP
jgi:DNA-binding response OmpR family regulator